MEATGALISAHVLLGEMRPCEDFYLLAEAPEKDPGTGASLSEDSPGGPPPFVGPRRFWGFDVSPPIWHIQQCYGSSGKDTGESHITHNRITEGIYSPVNPVFLLQRHVVADIRHPIDSGNFCLVNGN